MFITLSIVSDIRFAVMDILRGLGMSIVNIIYSTIDTLYEVAQKINGINFIQMLENVENSAFTKIFLSRIHISEKTICRSMSEQLLANPV